MADDITYKGKKIKRGTNMMAGAGWRLVKVIGGKQYFVGSLVGTINVNKKTRLAVFNVPKNTTT